MTDNDGLIDYREVLTNTGYSFNYRNGVSVIKRLIEANGLVLDKDYKVLPVRGGKRIYLTTEANNKLLIKAATPQGKVARDAEFAKLLKEL